MDEQHRRKKRKAMQGQEEAEVSKGMMTAEGISDARPEGVFWATFFLFASKVWQPGAGVPGEEWFRRDADEKKKPRTLNANKGDDKIAQYMRLGSQTR